MAITWDMRTGEFEVEGRQESRGGRRCPTYGAECGPAPFMEPEGGRREVALRLLTVDEARSYEEISDDVGLLLSLRR